jgi:hypothetical protein
MNWRTARNGHAMPASRLFCNHEKTATKQPANPTSQLYMYDEMDRRTDCQLPSMPCHATPINDAMRLAGSIIDCRLIFHVFAMLRFG